VLTGLLVTDAASADGLHAAGILLPTVKYCNYITLISNVALIATVFVFIKPSGTRINGNLARTKMCSGSENMQ
jgi:hypothetical protein